MPKHRHFIAKFTVGGGPSPLRELERILDLADSSPAREAWFGTHKPCTVGTAQGSAFCLRQRHRKRSLPKWLIGPTRHQTIPARWSFTEIEGNLLHGGISATRSGLSSGHLTKSPAVTGKVDSELPISAGVVDLHVPHLAIPIGAAAPDETSSATDSSSEVWYPPEFPVYGVDFSGGEENLRGNRKIWVATWVPGKNVALRCGWSDNTADKIRRRDLAGLIKRGSGWWSLDFPFGIAKETACALGLNSWQEWLSWCGREGDATMLRDEARKLTNRAGVAWRQLRQVDDSNQTTWFPLFEQLYRQTIYGAREVLLPLYEEGLCILPWGWKALKGTAVVVEGFPGATIRDHLLRRRVSYKGRTGAHKTAREAIVKALKAAPFAIPIPDDIAVKAVEDQDGDALDALVLLLASWISQRLSVDDWKQQLAVLDGRGATVEGWFPA